jgi:hypothetical protein
VSREQREALDELLREGPLDLGGDVAQQRAIFDEMMAAIPVPDDVAASPGSLGGISVVDVTVSGVDTAKVILYLHGGAYAIGSAASSVRLASDLARRAGARLVSVDYRLAPEHPHPAAVEDAVAAYRGLLGSEPVRDHHFGEGRYEQSERVIQRLLGVERELVSVAGLGVEAEADWDQLGTPETYLGYERSEQFASPDGAAVDERRAYQLPERLGFNRWALAGEWTIGR